MERITILNLSREILTGKMQDKTLVERIKELEVLVEQLAAGLNKQQSELVTLRTFVGFSND